jgi:hypothetical protein
MSCAATLLLAAGSGATAISSGAPNASKQSLPKSGTNTSTRPTTTVSTPTTTILTAPTGSATLSVILDGTTAPAEGDPIHGEVIVDNQTGKVILAPGSTCDGWIEVGLSNSQVTLKGAWSAVGCPALQIPIGISRYPLTVSTRYSSCLEPGGTSSQPTPRCIGPTSMEVPPLPPGIYTTTALGIPAPIKTAPPQRVTLAPPAI